MLRSLVLILLIVNAAFFAWSRGWLNDFVGVRPDAEHDPQRLSQQKYPERIAVEPMERAALASDSSRGREATAGASTASPQASAPGASAAMAGASASASGAASPVSSGAAQAGSAASAAATSHVAAAGGVPGTASSSSAASLAAASAGASNTQTAQAGGQCFEAGPFTAAEMPAAEAAVRSALPPGSWTRTGMTVPGLWLVYMGPYADPDMLVRKQAELRHIRGLNFEEVRTPANLAQGLSLGRYTRLEDAQAGLNALRLRGIRTARVVNVHPAVEGQALRVVHAGAAIQGGLGAAKLPAGKGFAACRP